MGEKIVVGPISKGLKTNRPPFAIDNDSFPTLLNAYQWRGRIKRKRGTSTLGRLQRFFNSSNPSYTSTSTITLAAGAGNLITGFGLETNSNIVPGSVIITDTITSDVYTDTSMDGTLSPSGTINYATGDILISAAGNDTVSVKLLYNPSLPVMGIEDLALVPTQFPGTLAFDTKYSYNVIQAAPYPIYDVSFYKNPPSATYADYVHKTNVTPLTWNGQDYQQFYTTNYLGALWTTNGINVPFNVTNIGMQFKPIVAVTIVSAGPPAIANLQITSHGLVVGDFVFVNEVATTTGINFQTGYVITVTDANNVVVEFPNATIASNGSGGIAQYLTNNADPTKDCLRWYDGDPTNGSSTNPTLNGNNGWVNFCPPLSKLSFSIADEPTATYYLVGARVIFPFKDRLLFFGPVIQTSGSSAPTYLQDTVIYSQNGTPYYTCSFTGDPSLANTVFNPILVPANQTATASAWFTDQTGYGGFQSVGLSSPILTVSPNEDALIVGMGSVQTRLVYTGNDLLPFNFLLINAELGTASTFSAINMDQGVLSRGTRGFTITSQVQCQRIDVEIPDSVFEINLTNNGNERFCAQRDYVNEWVYFTFPSNQFSYKFPTTTLQYNYRDDSWAVFYESYTTYGLFRKQTGWTWATLPQGLTWENWNESWNSGDSTLLQPEVLGGNTQGFLILRDQGTSEAQSLYIQDIVSGTITSVGHCLNIGDYIIISGAIGTIASEINGNIYSIASVSADTFTTNPALPTSGTYIGRGVIQRMYVPQIQTKQFPTGWGIAKKTRLGPQQYLLTTTNNGQITLQIFLSQNNESPYNYGPIVPSNNVQNNSLVYSNVLYTCPESTNLGLTPANINLQMVTSSNQSQTWHRMNTSLLGDSVQIGFTMSDAQMRDVNLRNQFSEIELFGFILDVNPSMDLA